VGTLSFGQCGNLDFTASIRKGCVPLVVKFKASGFQPGTRFQWNLQGSNLTGNDTITWVYTKPGTYKIQMIATPSSGPPCPAVVKDTFISLLPTPTPNMILSQGLNVCNGSNPVLFGDSTTNIVSRQWVMEGHTFSSKLVSYVFSSSGAKPVTLTVANKFGCTGSVTQTIMVNDSIPVDICADINVNNKTNVVASFTPFTGSIPPARKVASYNWTFPGGTPGSATTSTASVVKVTYVDNVNSYDVKLVVNMTDGCSYTILRKKFISPFLNPSITTICPRVSFLVSGDLSDSGRHNYSFFFTGASTFMTNAKDPDPKEGILTYTDPGSYPAKISYKYKGLGCPITINYPRFATILGPKANFVSKDNQLCKPTDTVHLQNLSDTTNASNVTYTWYVLDSGGGPPPGPPPYAKLIKKIRDQHQPRYFFYSGQSRSKFA